MCALQQGGVEAMIQELGDVERSLGLKAVEVGMVPCRYSTALV
jgi:hypothetical protein